MAVGARDAIDKKLVQMYANTQTSNLNTVSSVSPDQILNSMTLMSMNNRIFFEMKRTKTERKADIQVQQAS